MSEQNRQFMQSIVGSCQNYLADLQKGLAAIQRLVDQGDDRISTLEHLERLKQAVAKATKELEMAQDVATQSTPQGK